MEIKRFQNIRKIGVISDNHGAELPLNVLYRFSDVDLIIHCGDSEDFATLEPLKMIAPLIAVHGNMDPPEVSQVLPAKEIIEINGKFKIGIVHGYGAPEGLWERAKAEFHDESVEGVQLNAIIFGHSHYPFNDNIEGVLYFNPGTITEKRHTSINSFGIIRISDEQLQGEIIKVWEK